MLFSNGEQLPSNLPGLVAVNEMPTSYKYLSIPIDDNLSFKMHIVKLVSKLKLKLFFFFRNRSCFSLKIRVEKAFKFSVLPMWNDVEAKEKMTLDHEFVLCNHVTPFLYIYSTCSVL